MGDPLGPQVLHVKWLKAKFWAYAWMAHLANSVVDRAPGIRV